MKQVITGNFANNTCVQMSAAFTTPSVPSCLLASHRGRQLRKGALTCWVDRVDPNKLKLKIAKPTIIFMNGNNLRLHTVAILMVGHVAQILPHPYHSGKLRNLDK